MVNSKFSLVLIITLSTDYIDIKKVAFGGSNLKFNFQKWHSEVHLLFLKVAFGGSISGVIFGPVKN